MSSTTHTIDPNFKQGGTVGPIEQLDLTVAKPQTVAVLDSTGGQLSSFPLKMVAYSPDGTTPGTAVAELASTNVKGDLDGRMFVNTMHPRFGHKHLDGSSAYTDEVIVADPGDGFQTIITRITVATGAASAMNFFLEEGSTKIFGPIYLEAISGRGFSADMFLPITASTAVTITTSSAIAQSVDIDYFIQAV